MRVLVIKTSSLGDVIHTLPAITEAKKNVWSFNHIHWVVEKTFSEVLNWHPVVDQVIPVELRKWRKQPFSSATRREWNAFKNKVKENFYDIVIDAQGLMKSAFLMRYVIGMHKFGLDWQSAWEPLSIFFYHNKISVDPSQHAVNRMRQLFGKVLEYQPDDVWTNYGIDRSKLITTHTPSAKDYVCLCHGTTWVTKEWPETYWKDLATIISSHGLGVVIPFGNSLEEERARRIADACPNAEVLPKMSLTSIAGIISKAKGVVAVDTGLGHLSAALGVPCVSVYGPTDPKATGTIGDHQLHLADSLPCSPCLNETCKIKSDASVQPACFEKLAPQRVWGSLEGLMS